MNREEMAERYGYYRWVCREHGTSGWTDSGPDCAECAAEEEADEMRAADEGDEESEEEDGQ